MESQSIQLRRAKAMRSGRRAAATAAVIAIAISGSEWYRGRDSMHIALPLLGLVVMGPLLYVASLVAERATRSWWGPAD